MKPSGIAGRGRYANAPHVRFVALRDVAAGEELILDYGTIDHDAEPMACRCGAAACRGTTAGEDWRRPDLRQKYGDHFAWHLLRRMRAEQ